MVRTMRQVVVARFRSGHRGEWAALVLTIAGWLGGSAVAKEWKLREQELPTRLTVGYAVRLLDMNADGRLDICIVDADRILWLENPNWTEHTLIGPGQTKKDNVCFAPYDIDGDGQLDFAVGADWRPFDTKTGGTIQWIGRTEKADAPWQVFPIGEEPTVHRMQFADLDGDGRAELLVSPLMGRDTTRPSFSERPVRLLAYTIPKDPRRGPWVPQVLNEDVHVSHNLWPTDLDGDGKLDLLLVSFEGVHVLQRQADGSWRRTRIGTGNQQTSPNLGASEIKRGLLAKGDYLATIEPWHGSQVVVYTRPETPPPATGEWLWKRHVLDDQLAWGHGVWCANLDDDPEEELIIGVRDDVNAENRRGVRIFDPIDPAAGKWDRQVIDPGSVAVEDLIAGDLNGDGRQDIVAVGRQTHNVKIYWNEQRDAQDAQAWTPELMMRVKRVSSVQVSPDGQRTVFSVREAVMEGDRSEYRTHLHVTTVDGRSSQPLTAGERSCEEPQWSPQGDWIAFLSNRSGPSEPAGASAAAGTPAAKKNLWIIRPDGGDPVQLTSVPSDIISFQWSPDGRRLAFALPDPPTAEDQRRARQKDDARVVDVDVKRNRLAVIDVASPPVIQRELRFLTPPEMNIVSESSRPGRATYDWSPDGRWLVFTHSRSPAADDWGTADLSVVDATTGAIRTLATTPAVETFPLVSPDGRFIAFLASDQPPTWAGSRTIHVVSSQGGTPRKLAETRDGFGRYSELVGWSADGTRLYFTETHGTVLKLLAMPLEGEPTELSRDGGMSLSGVSLNVRRTHFGWAWERLDRPGEGMVSAVTPWEPKTISRVHEALPRPALGRTEVVRWKSTEGFEVEGLLTYPVDYQPGRRYPLLLVIHGGPMGVFTQTFDATPATYPVAAFAARGYLVLRPNPRGSSGYGRKFRYANYGDWGGGDYRDLMAGVDHVVQQGVADPDRLGVMGWSYGGFMTSWVITQTKRFRAASVGAGVTNLMSFTGTSDIPGFLPDYFGGEYWDKFEAYRGHSPMFHVKGVTTPTLIQHGERDERVPYSQGQELYNALKRQGCVTTMIAYPRSPHAIEEPRLLLDCMRRNLEWFERHVPASAR